MTILLYNDFIRKHLLSSNYLNLKTFQIYYNTTDEQGRRVEVLQIKITFIDSKPSSTHLQLPTQPLTLSPVNKNANHFFKMLITSFSNSLIIHQVKTKEGNHNRVGGLDTGLN